VIEIGLVAFTFSHEGEIGDVTDTMVDFNSRLTLSAGKSRLSVGRWQ